MKGKIIENISNLYKVEANKEIYEATARGKFKKDEITPVVGDNVEIEKYSHVASLEEVKENNYNLNIPRYIDTFEEEKLIDIEKINADINEIKKQIACTENEIDNYLKELGI